MAKKKSNKWDFWQSYGDLVTGLMMVFLLTMVLAILQMSVEIKNRNIRDEKTKKMVNSLSGSITTSVEIASTIKDAIGKDFKVDPLTGKLRIPAKKLKFEKVGQTELSDQGLQVLANFGPNYLCAIWAHEYQDCMQKKTSDCRRINPDQALAVNKIIIQGNADLQEAKPGVNLVISSQRAYHVDKSLTSLLRKAVTENIQIYTKGVNAELCNAHPDLVWNFVQERLVSVGAGHLEDCKKLSRNLGGQCETADKMLSKNALDDPYYRSVTFDFRLTNADVTSLVVAITQMQLTLQQKIVLQPIIDQITGVCWSEGDGEGPLTYAACADIARICQKTGEPTQEKLRTILHCADYQRYCATDKSSVFCE